MAFRTDFGLGTLISNASNLWGTGAHLAREREDQRRDRSMWDSEFQRQQLTPDFLARVEAAKAAGIHPLIAFGGGVGGGGGSVSPVVSDSSPMPQFEFSSDRKEDPNLTRLNAARADLAELQVEEARRKLAAQPGNQGGMIGDMWKETPREVTSVARGMPYLEAGPPSASESPYTVRNPFTGDIQTGTLPGKDIANLFENMGEFWGTLLSTPFAGRFVWDAMIPDKLKPRMFEFLDLLGEVARARTAPERGRGASGSW